MATAEELLNSVLKNEASVLSATDAVFVIDGESRTINVPDSERLFGVEGDKDVERKYFQCPKIVGDNQDLSQDYILFINYVNANGDPDAYKISDMQVEGDNITFSWLLEENVTKYKGSIQIAFAAIIPGDEAGDPDKNRWNTTINTDCTCLIGLKCTQQVAESNPDALAQIWAAIDELKAGGGGSGTPGKDGREIEIRNNGTAIQWRYVGDSDWIDLVQLSDLKGEGIPEGGTTGQVLTKNSNSDGDASWKNPSIVSDEQVKTAVDKYLEENPVQGGSEYFEVLNNVSSGTLIVGIPPASWNTDNDDWKSVRHGSVLQNFMGGNGVAPIIVNKKILIPSGTIYVRMVLSNIYSTSVGSYGIYSVSAPILPEEYSEEMEATCEKVAEESVTTDFNIGGDTRKWYIDSVGDVYPYSDVSGADESVPEYCGGIVLKKYVIPEGKYGWLSASSLLGDAVTSNIRWNPAGYPAIFTTDPTDNITQSVNSGEEGESGGQLKPKDEYVEGFMKFIADNSSFQAYFSEYINNFIPLTSKRQTFGKAIYIGGDSLHAYAGGDGFSTSGFVTNWNKYLGFARVTNAGYAGSKWSETTGGGGIKKAKYLISSGTVYDVIILAWGTNDDAGGNGTIDDEASDADGATMVAAMKWIITNLRNTFKNTSIGVIIPPPKNTDDGMKIKGDLMIQVCELLHVPYVDMREYISISDLDGDHVHLGTGAGKYGAAEASLIMRICQYGDTLYPGNSENA